jgi:hypothetical protein
MDYLNELRENVERQLKDMTKKTDLTPNEVENIKNALCCLDEIDARMEMDGSSYGHPDSMYYSRRHSDQMRYDERRDSRGRYSRHSIKDRMISRLEGMADEAQSDYEREAINSWISRLERETN